jgi:transcriptional regulator with GAF, ATPase, and Fis domain
MFSYSVIRNRREMDNNEFFREATLRICGNLKIEEAIYSAFEYIRTEIPIDRMFLQFYDRKSKQMRIIANATPEGSKSVDWVVPLTNDGLNDLANHASEFSEQDQDFHWFFGDNPNQHALIRDIFSFLNCNVSSLVVIPLRLRDNQLIGGGSLIIATEGEIKISQEQYKQLAMLREPFAIAFSNSLKHESEIKLYSRDFFWEASKRILGNLKIEQGLRECLLHLKEFMPADEIYLERYKTDLDSMHLIAYANKETCKSMDILVPFTPEAKQTLVDLAEVYRNGKLPPVIVVNDPEQEPVTRCMLNALNLPMSSAMSLPLIIGNKSVGTVALIAEGNDRYTEEHAKLFASLREPFFVAMLNTLKHREVLELKDLLTDDNKYLHNELRKISGDEIIGVNFGLRDVMHKVQQVASLNSPVILLGETGVGKDVIANAIHYSSSRSNGPFVSVNCGAIPDTLIDSELFGHEKGAFTGALAQKRGRFERANQGTIFLDEIGELPPQAQVRLLKVLQSKEIERVGGVKTISLDIRIIAATNRNLEQMVKDGEFREDLWFRLNVFPVWIPPLRDRVSDIPALIQYFISKKARELKLHSIPKLAEGAMTTLTHYHWPGNVRELENIVERELILNQTGPLSFEQLKGNVSTSSKTIGLQEGEIATLDEMAVRHIRNTLTVTNGKIHGAGGAAELLGINANTLRNRMNKLGINYKKDQV